MSFGHVFLITERIYCSVVVLAFTWGHVLWKVKNRIHIQILTPSNVSPYITLFAQPAAIAA